MQSSFEDTPTYYFINNKRESCEQHARLCSCPFKACPFKGLHQLFKRFDIFFPLFQCLPATFGKLSSSCRNTSSINRDVLEAERFQSVPN